MDSLSLDTVVVASPDQVSSELDGEIVVLNHRQGVYFGLDAGVGALVWRAVQSPVRVGDVVSTVLDRFDVDEARCTQDVTTLLNEMLSAGLLQTAPGGG
jgi:hypothetical protein